MNNTQGLIRTDLFKIAQLDQLSRAQKWPVIAIPAIVLNARRES